MRFSHRCMTNLFNGLIANKLHHYSQFQPMALTIQQYLDFGRHGTATSSYMFLKKELLVRLANIMQEIQLLPPRLLLTQSAGTVADWYRASFEELLLFENADVSTQNVERFGDQLERILRRHATVVQTMARALIELREQDGVELASERGIQYFLDRFYLNRISIRMLEYQHLSIAGARQPEAPRYVGCIDPMCDVRAVINDAYESSLEECERHFRCFPTVNIECHNNNHINAVHDSSLFTDEPIRIVAVPLHIYYIMFELLKNAMRATVENNNIDALPPINVNVVCGAEDLSIKISDRGGGIPRTCLERLFNYTYSTAPTPPTDGDHIPLCGYGTGLPISRLYARYFHGDLFLTSMEGFGTDAHVYFKAVPMQASEVLPNFCASSRRRIAETVAETADWSHPIPQLHEMVA